MLPGNITSEILIDFLQQTQRHAPDTEIHIDDLRSGRHTLVIKTSDKPPKQFITPGEFNLDHFNSWFGPTKQKQK